MHAPLDPDKLRRGDAATVAAFRSVLRRRIGVFFHKQSQINAVTNDTLVELLTKLERGEQPTEVFYWALNAVNNAIRRELTRVRRQVLVTYESHLHGLDEADPTAVIDATAELERLDALLTKVDDVSLQVLFAAVQGEKHRDIANQLGINPGAARQSLSRLRAELRSHLTTHERRAKLRQLVQQAGLGHEPPPVPHATTPDSSSSSSA